MPGPVSESFKGPPDDGPYVPSWLYKNGPRMCPCGHHEGYHNDYGRCILIGECKCGGLPVDCLTPTEEM
jgi:hypothetical protein